MAQLHTIGPGLDPDDLWRNIFWLRTRIEHVEALTRRLQQELKDAREEFWEYEAEQDKVE